MSPTLQEQDEESWGGGDQTLAQYVDSDCETVGKEKIESREAARVLELESENQVLRAKLAEMAVTLAAAESQSLNARMMV